jgi:anti-anti-sigma factor
MAHDPASAFSFRVESSRDALAHLVHLGGELDLETAAPLKTMLVGLRGDVAVDHSRVTFLDSVGLATLVSAQQRLASQGGSLQLVNLSTATYRVFDTCGLVDLFGIEAPGA